LAPRKPNFNPVDSVQQGKSAWVHDLDLLNQTLLDYGDMAHRRRLQALQGVDEIIDDVFATLHARNALEDTYGSCTSKNSVSIGLLISNSCIHIG
jgi:N-acetylglucosamine-6-sulfatase